MFVGNLKRTARRCQDPVYGRGLKFFTPLKGIYFKATLTFLGFIAVRVDTAKAPDVGPFEREHQDVKSAFLTPKTYDE